MSGFLSATQESGIQSLFGTLHETFARTITVYQNSEVTSIALSPQYNSVYGRRSAGADADITYTTVSGSYLARVYYLKSQEETFSNNNAFEGTQNKIIFPIGSVKIVVEADAYDFLKEARKVELDGRLFAVKSDGNPSSLIGNQFYSFFLTPLEE